MPIASTLQAALPLPLRGRAHRAARRRRVAASRSPDGETRPRPARWSSPTATSGSRAGRLPGTSTASRCTRTTTAPPSRSRQGVLVVGIGNSAVDIAVDVCKSASRTFLSTRRSAWVMPKYIMGIPIDRWAAFFGGKLRLPTPVARTLVRWLAFLVGRRPAPLRRAAAAASDLARTRDAQPGAAAVLRSRLDPHEAERARTARRCRSRSSTAAASGSTRSS